MEDKNNGKSTAAMRATIVFCVVGGLLIFAGLRAASSAMGILGLIIGVVLVFTGIYGAKHKKEANELLTAANNDPSYAHDKEVLECLENILQSINDELPKDPSVQDRNIIAKRMGDTNQFIAFGKKAIEKGALMVLSTYTAFDGTKTKYSWHVFTNHIYTSIEATFTTRGFLLCQSPDISSSKGLFTFICHKEKIEGHTTYKTNASVGGRAVAGAAIAGPVGAVVGAISAADKNNTGGVTKTKKYTAGHEYYIRFKNEDVDVICINDKALGETKEDMESFLTHDLHLSKSSGDIILNLKKINLNKDNKYKLTSILSNILKNIQNAQ